MFSIMRPFAGNVNKTCVYDNVLHMVLEKCVKQIGATFLVFTKFCHMGSSGTVKVFVLQELEV